MSIVEIYPRVYYTSELSSESQQKTQEIFEDYLNDESLYSTPKFWNCNVHTSYDFGVPDEFGLWQQWIPIIKPHIISMFDELNVDTEVDIKFSGMWVNKYIKGDNQEYHEHAGTDCTLSLVYFHRIHPDDGSKFVFYGPEYPIKMATGLAKIFPILDAKHHVPYVKQGTIIIFPSYYAHMVTVHTGENERITFSANLKLTAPEPIHI